MTDTDTAEEIAQKVAAQASFDALLIENLRSIRETVGRVEVKVDGNGTRMDMLIDTTNHRLDDFRLSLDAHASEFRIAINKKVDKTELLTSFGFKIADTKLVRWGLGLLLATVVGTAAFEHWYGALVSLLPGM